MEERINPYQQYMYSYPHKTAYQREESLDIEDYRSYIEGKKSTLYIHVPFCESKCGYCNLFSVAGHKSWIDDYIDAIKRQVEQWKQKLDFASIDFDALIFGGGTPMLLDIFQFEELFEVVEQLIWPKTLNDIDIDIETSPNQTSEIILDYLKKKGIHRISIGIQSFVEEELSIIARNHRPEQAEEALKAIMRLKFPLTNLDLIYGIPEQTVESLNYSLEKALIYKPNEIFAYPLYQKPNTGIAGKFIMDTQKQRQLYDVLRNFLTAAGYRQVSMRRFTKEPRQTACSCGFENTISLGCGGRSYIGPLHFCEPYAVSPELCKKRLLEFIGKKDFFRKLSVFRLDGEEQRRRYLIKNLLHIEGVVEEEYAQVYDKNLWKDFPVLWDFVDKAWIKRTNGKLKLTLEGLAMSDALGPMLMSEKVVERMRAFYGSNQN